MTIEISVNTASIVQSFATALRNAHSFKARCYAEQALDRVYDGDRAAAVFLARRAARLDRAFGELSQRIAFAA